VSTPDGPAREPALGSLSHDLRTPLAVIVGFADVLANRDALSDEERREFASRITAAAGEIRDLINRAGL